MNEDQLSRLLSRIDALEEQLDRANERIATLEATPCMSIPARLKTTGMLLSGRNVR